MPDPTPTAPRRLAGRARRRLGAVRSAARRGGRGDLAAGQARIEEALERQRVALEGLAQRVVAIEATLTEAASAAGLIDTRNAGYDALTEEIIRRTLGPGSTGVDVGAHSGLILRAIVDAAPDGRHWAFEPIPELAARLRDEYPDVEVHQLALSDEAGTTSFHHVTSNPSFSGILERDYMGPEEVVLIEVERARLDDVIPDDVPVHLLKIDVEGGELGVLRGATRILDQHHPVVVFEFGPGASNHYGTTPQELHDFLAEHGMAVAPLDGYLRDDPGLTAEELEQQYVGLVNYYFVAYPAPGP